MFGERDGTERLKVLLASTPTSPSIDLYIRVENNVNLDSYY